MSPPSKRLHYNSPRLSERRASASRGLFCLSRASWSGLASSRSRTNLGSSSLPTDSGGARLASGLAVLVVVVVACAAPKLDDRGVDDEEGDDGGGGEEGE